MFYRQDLLLFSGRHWSLSFCIVLVVNSAFSTFTQCCKNLCAMTTLGMRDPKILAIVERWSNDEKGPKSNGHGRQVVAIRLSSTVNVSSTSFGPFKSR